MVAAKLGINSISANHVLPTSKEYNRSEFFYVNNIDKI